MTAHHADPDTRRSIHTGEIVGFSFSKDTHAWWGIPYAAPPIGPLRWRAPRDATPWEGTRSCTRYGDMSLQLKSFMTNSPQSQWNKPVGSEDCLTLNVFAPKQLPDEPLPVMVWIHGGGNTGGASSMYSIAGNLPTPFNVIVVSVNYRLGVFGWCYHPSLFDASCSAEDRSGNFGTLDLIQALTWVQTNIRQFGGNPANVTIFGESAGGQNVLSLYVSPLAQGLFHKAIAQSPVTASVRPEEGYHAPGEPGAHRGNITDILCKLLVAEGRARSQQAAEQMVRGMSPHDIREYLFRKDADQILDMYNSKMVGIYESPRLFRDGHVLPARPLIEAFADTATSSDVPLLIGTNRDEMKLFMMMSREYITPKFGRVPVIKNLTRYQLDADYFSRMWKATGVDEVLHRLYARGQRQLWCYRFDWDEIPPLPVIRPDILIGATHVMEIPFVFNDRKGVFNPFKTFTKRNQASRLATTTAMASYWTRFAHTGSPDANDLPAWHAWQPGSDANTLVIDADGSGGIRMEHTCETIASLKHGLRSDKRLLRRDKERLRLYVRMFMMGGLFGNHSSEADFQAWSGRGAATPPSAGFRGERLL